MQAHTALSDLLRVFFSDAAADEAVTLCRREPLSALIVDARFVLATPAALRLYGRSADEMCTWHSLTQPLEEAKRSRAMAAARHVFPGDVPSRYLTELLTPSGAVVPVVKDTREVLIDGESHWLTRLAPAASAPDLPHTTAIALPANSAEQMAFSGRYSMADVHLLLEADEAPSHIEWQERSTTSILDSINLSREGDALPRLTEEGYALVFGEPLIRLPSGQYMFECQHCGWIWIPKKRQGKAWSAVESEDIMVPERCGNPERHCYHWQEGGVRRAGRKPTRDRTALRKKRLNPLQP
jgi:hypothetical protein